MQRREHYLANKERICAAARAYYEANIDAQRASALDRHHRNRDKRIRQQREYRAKHLDELLAKQRARHHETWRDRYGADLEFTLKHRVRALIRVTLTKGRDGLRMRELLGYGTEELRAHLERQFTQGMNWTRFMAGEIHIDHIVPVSAFDIQSPDSPEFRACWALSNLRPMWARDNLSKAGKVLTLL